MDAARRKEVIAELAANGYSSQYIDSWPAKVTLYRHQPGLNMDGDIVFRVGSSVPNQPGHPDHAARKSRFGWLPWLPSETCKCKGCRERVAAQVAAQDAGQIAPVEPEVKAQQAQKPKAERKMISQKCEFCDFVASSTYKMPLLNKLRAHVRRTHIKESIPAEPVTVAVG
jgi:hypothetical protein